MNQNPIPTHIRRMAVLVVFIALSFSVLGSPAASTAIAQEPTPTDDVSGQNGTVNLAVTNIGIFSPDTDLDPKIYANDDVKVYIYVYNLGDTASGSFTVNIYLDSVPPVNPEDCNNIGRDYYYNSTGLGGGSFETLQITIPAGNLIAGQYSITAYADSGCVIGEDDETDNIATQEFTVHPQTISAPDHDSVGSPRVIASLPYTDTVDVRGATRHASDPTGMTCTTLNGTRVVDAGLASVWYQYTAASDTTLFVDTFGSNYDTYLAAWQGGMPGVGTLIGCNEDSGGVHQSALPVPVTNGTTYYFLVAQFSNDITNVEVEGASLDGKSSTDVEAQAGGGLSFQVREGADIDVTIGGNLMGSYTVPPGEEKREYYNVSDGPVVVESINDMDIVSAIRLQSFANNTLHSFVETMGVPSGLLSHKYFFPTYNNTWGPLNSQVRFGNLDADPTTIRVTIGGVNVWEDEVPGLDERRLYFPVSGGPVVIESLDVSKKIVAAIRLQSFANNTLYSFSETMGIPAEQMSDVYYFPTYNNTWGPLNSQLRFGNLDASSTTIRVTIGGVNVWEDVVPGLEERRLTFDVSGGPVKVESLDPSKKIVSAIRLQSFANNTLHSFVETMGVPDGLLSYKYYFPTYNNTWGPLNSQVRFGNLDADPTTIRVTIGGVNVWEDEVPGLEERRLYFDVSGGPVVIESLDVSKKIVAAIRLQSFANNTLYSFSETMGIPAEQMSDVYYFPTYNNTWGPLNSQLRFGVP
jgi:hypothetical protein